MVFVILAIHEICPRKMCGLSNSNNKFCRKRKSILYTPLVEDFKSSELTMINFIKKNPEMANTPIAKVYYVL